MPYIQSNPDGIVGAFLRWLVHFLVGSLGTFLVAFVCYVLVEKPAMDARTVFEMDALNTSNVKGTNSLYEAHPRAESQLQPEARERKCTLSI